MPRKWKTVRIFISSTFSDMHTERDHLVRFIFPELKEKCRQNHVHLIDVDLRWGVTEADAEDGKALDICLDEIDSCRPYFLGLLGHRYGWVPPDEEHSITAQEIYHGVLHNEIPKQVVDLRQIIDGKLEGKVLTQEQVNSIVSCYLWDAELGKYLLRDDVSDEERENIRAAFAQYSVYQRDRSFFFFRSETLTKKLAGTEVENYFESSKATQDKLAALKQDIVDEGLLWFEYDNIEAFGEKVGETLWQRIEAELGEKIEAEKDWLEEEAEFHELFMADRTRRFVGRRDVLDRMRTFCQQQDQSSIMIITGESGCGKSALMARFTEEIIYDHLDWLILPHFVGASPGSTSLRQTLRRLCEHLSRIIKSQETVPEDTKELLSMFPDLLAKAAEERRVLIILDALNQFEKTDNALSMHWLPQKLPENVRFVVSTLAGEAFDALQNREQTPKVEYVIGLDEFEIKKLVVDYLNEIRHEFPNEQVEGEFFHKVKAGNPLFIQVALEELRVFGKFEKLADRVGQLPGTVPALFDQVLERIETDFDIELVRETMAFIACGQQGMAAEELQTLLRAHAPRLDAGTEPDKLPDMLWARLYRAFGTYLFERSGVIDFFHRQMHEAVENRYFKEEPTRLQTHQSIANLFQGKWRKRDKRALNELVYQLGEAKNWKELKSVLLDMEFLELKTDSFGVYDLKSDFNQALDLIPEDHPSRGSLSSLHDVIEEEAFVVAEDPSILFQQLFNKLNWLGEDDTRLRNMVQNAESSLRSVWFKRLKHRSSGDDLKPLKIFSREGFCSVAYSGDGEKIAAAGSTKNILVWSTKTGELYAEMDGHKPYNRCLAFSPDSRLLASGGDDNIVRLWDAETGLAAGTLRGHRKTIYSLAFSPNGRFLASGDCDGEIILWNLSSETETGRFHHDDGLGSITYCGDDLLASCGKSSVCLWSIDAAGLYRRLMGTDRYFRSVDFCPHNQLLASVDFVGGVSIWDCRNGELQKEWSFKDKQAVMQEAKVKFSPDGTLLAVALTDSMMSSELRLIDTSTWQLIAVSDINGSHIAFSPDSKKLVAAYDGLMLWNLTDMQKQSKQPKQGHKDSLGIITYSPDGKVVATGSGQKLSEYLSADHTVRIWDADSEELLQVFESNRASIALAFAPDGKMLVSATDKDVEIWDIQGNQVIQKLNMDGNVFAMAFSLDAKILFMGGLERLLMFDLESNHVVWKNTEYIEGIISSLALDEEGHTLAALTGNPDNMVTLWDSASGILKRRLQIDARYAHAVRFSADGNLLSVATSENLQLWDPFTGTLVQNLPGGVHEVDFFQSRNLIAGLDMYKLRLWDLGTGAQIAWIPTSAIPRALRFDQMGSIIRIATANINHYPEIHAFEIQGLTKS